MKNVVGYLRVSTDGQIDKYGIDAQRSDIMTYCAKNDMYIAKWYCDEGVSGVKEERPAFDEILYGEVENPPYEAVVVAKNDRIARDINVYYYFKMLLKKKDVELISVSEDFGQFGVMASMLEAFTLCVAEMERENIKRRTMAGRREKAAEGGFSGGRPPYGYKVVEHELVLVEEEAEVVRDIFRCRSVRMTMKEIAELLNMKGVSKRNGKPVDQSMVQSILGNEEFYRGVYSYGGKSTQGVHTAIL